MSRTTEDIQRDILKMQTDIRTGLSSIETDKNWLDKYEEWSRQDRNQFDALLEIKDSFDLSCVGDSHAFDLSSEDDKLDLDIIKMSVFLSESLTDYLKQTLSDLRNERNRENKQILIERYFGVADSITDCPQLSPSIVTLNDFAERQMALHGQRTVDLYLSFFSLRERLRKSSTESLYLLFTYWRLTRLKKDLKKLVSSLIDYIRTYYYDFDNDPDMKLFRPVDGLMIIKKLEIITEWLERVAFHTEQIAEKYKEMDWMQPVDSLADHIVSANQISKYEMLQYKRIFEVDDNDTVRKKAVCYHGYAVWIKTVDVMFIVRELYKVLNQLPEDELKKMNASKAYILNQYDIMDKIYNRYTSKVFYHKVYYDQERHNIDSLIMETLEDDAKLISDSIDNVNEFIDAIAADDIKGLMQAKQKYISGLKEFTSKEQEEKLDELTVRVTNKIKEIIQKQSIYDDLYAAVSDGFNPYAGELMKYPKLFNSLVSAEYLYKQYVDGKEPNEQFDYSCISIMYYMALEDFANKLVYIPYAKDVLSGLDDSELKGKKWTKYVSSLGIFWKYNKKKDSYTFIKDSCEIGVLGFLFEGVETEEKLKDYVLSRYPKADIKLLKKLGTELKKVAPRRNEAAHGGNYLAHADVCTDKGHVYDSSVSKLRGLIIELLEMLFAA